MADGWGKARGIAVALFCGIAAVPALAVGPSAPGNNASSSRSPSPAPAPAGNQRSGQQAGSTTPPPQPLSQDAAARSRMHECGHQWSTMKKAGTTGTLTWKEFSATCLVVSR